MHHQRHALFFASILLSLLPAPSVASAQSTNPPKTAPAAANPTETAATANPTETAATANPTETAATANPTETAAAAETDQNTAAPLHPLIEKALSCTPPERAAYGKQIAQSPETLEQLDAWIQNTTVDHPKNLIVKDLLLAMDPATAGPRMVRLASKSADPDIQQSYVRWLQKYPDAYAHVLFAWLKQNNGNTAHFLDLLIEYDRLRPDSTLPIWAQMMSRYPIAELGNIPTFGYKKAGCAQSLIPIITTADDEIVKLRTARALIHCSDAQTTSANTLSDWMTTLFADSRPSRRIVAIDLSAALHLSDALPKLSDLFDHAKNTTERAHALRALDVLDTSDAQNHRLADALNGDETLRFEAARLLSTQAKLPPETLQTAFLKEIWPDTLFFLYRALSTAAPDDAQLLSLRRQIFLSPERPEILRRAALSDIAQSAPQSLSLDDFYTLTREAAPSITLIAETAETLYATQPNLRPRLRNWLKAQQPFERRFVTSLSRFIAIDNKDSDDASLPIMRDICSSEKRQELIVQPCLNYFQTHFTDEDSALIESLKKHQNQLDAMSNFEF